MNINETAIEMHEIARSKGWYDPPKSDGEALLLMHAEISEAAEELRMFGLLTVNDATNKVVTMGPTTVYYDNDNPGKPEGFGIELADCVIRIMDTCVYLGIDLEAAIRLKADFNKTRPARHGGKTL